MTLRQRALALSASASAIAKARRDPRAHVHTHVTEAVLLLESFFRGPTQFRRVVCAWAREHEDHRSNYVAQFVEQISRSKALTTQSVVCY